MTQERFEFQTETQELLELMIHSLYSNRDIFLRELISNASDAIDKRRFAALTGEVPAIDEPQIRITIDADNRVLAIHDDGIGMSRDEVVANIGTIARSGTKEFAAAMANREQLAERPELIGQFGVGFYSAFLVADSVELVTRRAGSDHAVRWTSAGHGGYTIEDAERELPGTSITLRLKPADAEDGLRDYADERVVRDIVKRYSDFVAYPIRLGEGEPVNSMKAIWTRPAAEVGDDEYAQFYRHVSHDWEDPRLRISTKIEGTFEASALLFVPKRAPFDLYVPTVSQRGVQLYVKRVFIMEDCKELIPSYLRFVRGVVDAEDLPLNVSRELLQENRQIKAIRNHLVKKVLDRLAAYLEEDVDGYRETWTEFGAVLKEGLLLSGERNERILDLMLVRTTAGTEPTTLAAYVERMKDDQKVIYYLSGPSEDKLRASPVIEGLVDQGIEVLLFCDQVDEVWLGQGGFRYRDCEFRSASQLEADSVDQAPPTGALGELLLAIRSVLQDRVKDVRASSRLTKSPSCLVSGQGDLTPQMEALLRASGQAVPATKRVLELNPKHPVIELLQRRFAASSSDPLIASYAELLYGQAVLAEGGELAQPVEFARLVAELMVAAAREA